ncbi:alpha/beta hydrolase [Aquamicrobium sp. LC103]|uniref:alpha/beta hydrolase n=1 Tax=Aquamicrobium sp. LC103 TaxID=1120658 RepID=UPI00063ECC79|nr:alpha/beta hydrolase [Aquamicrobium sp. LC103]TKT79179.1 alpha/beta hydrolase [Aquamicrobium sp. LC103]
MATFGFQVIRSIFSVAEHFAPRLSGRAAFALFCRTADPNRVSGKEASMIADAAAFMAEARHHCLTTNYGRVTAHDFRPAAEGAPRALVIHGWGSRTEHMRRVVESLRDEGFRVISLDLPGHGASSGRYLNMAVAVAAVHATAQWLGPFQAVVGHSFGGAVAVNAAAGSVRGFDPISAQRLVLIASPSSMPALFEDFGRFLKLGPRTQTALAERVQVVAGRPLEDYVAATQLRELGIPTLVVHAPDDKEISFENARQFEDAGRHVRLMRAPGRGHRRILADGEVTAAVAAFAAEPAARANAA